MSAYRKPILAGLHPVIAALIRARCDRDMSQAALSERLGLAQGVLSRWESGRVNVRLRDLTRWAAVFGLAVYVAGPDAVDGPIPELIAGGLS